MAPNATGDKTIPKTVIPIIEMAKMLFKNFQKSGTEYNLFLNPSQKIVSNFRFKSDKRPHILLQIFVPKNNSSFYIKTRSISSDGIKVK